jgi:predicted small secreted protein
MNKTKLIISVLLVGTLLSGCNKDTHYKEDIQASLKKQSEMKNYSFTGDADLALGNFIPQAKDSNPITTNLLGILQNSKLAYTGIVNTEPVQLEVDLTATPAALAGASLDLPIILKDNKLYLNIPLLNQKDEYFSIDLTKLGTTANPQSLLSPNSLKNVSQVASSISNLIISDMEEKWFDKAKTAVTLKDGSKASTFSVQVDDKNKAALSASLQTKLPEMITALNTNGILSAEQADQLKQSNFKSIQVATPSSVIFTIDEAGFIREQQVNLTFTMPDETGTAVSHHINLHQTYEQINQSPKFTKEIPQKIKPFEDILKLLAPKK